VSFVVKKRSNHKADKGKDTRSAQRKRKKKARIKKIDINLCVLCEKSLCPLWLKNKSNHKAHKVKGTQSTQSKKKEEGQDKKN
jgi:hypothetical protein